jgi:hypothetical protein
MGSYVSTWRRTSFTSISLGEPPAIKSWMNSKVNHAYQSKRGHRGPPCSIYYRHDQGCLGLAAPIRLVGNAPHVNLTSNSITDSPASVSADRLNHACFDCDRLCGQRSRTRRRQPAASGSSADDIACGRTSITKAQIMTSTRRRYASIFAKS